MPGLELPRGSRTLIDTGYNIPAEGRLLIAFENSMDWEDMTDYFESEMADLGYQMVTQDRILTGNGERLPNALDRVREFRLRGEYIVRLTNTEGMRASLDLAEGEGFEESGDYQLSVRRFPD